MEYNLKALIIEQLTNENQHVIKEVNNSIQNIDIKNRKQLLELFHNPVEMISSYELSERNLQNLNRLSKFCSKSKIVEH